RAALLGVAGTRRTGRSASTARSTVALVAALVPPATIRLAPYRAAAAATRRRPSPPPRAPPCRTARRRAHRGRTTARGPGRRPDPPRIGAPSNRFPAICHCLAFHR